MKRIWIDGFEANVPQRVGSGQVAIELLRNIERIDKKNDYTILLASSPLDDLPKERDGWKYKILKLNRLKTWLAIPFALYTAQQKPDLIFSPTHYIPRFSPVKRVVTIFDLAYLHFPQMFGKKDLIKLINWTKFSILKSDHIITISNFTKKDIIKNYNVSEAKITVAYPGYDKEKFRPISDTKRRSEILEKYHIDGRYIIYVGTIQPRKNLLRLIGAMKEIEGVKLVIVGKTKGLGREGWMFEEILGAPQKFGIEDRVIFTGFVPTEDLPYLISGAEAFVWPSLWEGFGIPPLEAMACGTPVVVSDVSSLPEVVGDAGVIINQESITHIKEGILKILEDREFHQKMSKKGLEQAKKFSWEKMAKEVLVTFEKLA